VVARIKHPNCLECHGVISRPRICFVLELCEKGSMYDILTKSFYKLDWTNLFRWFINTLDGLLYLHNFNPCVLHRDIKSKNLLVCPAIYLCMCESNS
jgi:serine/threonine protein kinase